MACSFAPGQLRPLGVERQENLGGSCACSAGLCWVGTAERLELPDRCRDLLMVSLWQGFGLPALVAMA